jgi:hypothetical protein
MTTIGAAFRSAPISQGQPPPPPPKKTNRDNDGDEHAETAATKAAETTGQTKHKVDMQA